MMELTVGAIYLAKCLYTLDAFRQIACIVGARNRSKIEVIHAIAQGIFSLAQMGDIFVRAFSVINATQCDWAIAAAR